MSVCTINILSNNPELKAGLIADIVGHPTNPSDAKLLAAAAIQLEEAIEDRAALIVKINSTPEGRKALKEFNNPTPKPEPGALDFGTKSPNKTPFNLRNVLADWFKQSATNELDGSSLPLVGVKDFLSNLTNTTALAYLKMNKVTDELTEKQQKLIVLFKKTATSWGIDFKNNLVKETAEDKQRKNYDHPDLTQGLIQDVLDEEGKVIGLDLPENVKTAMAFAIFKVVSTSAAKFINVNTDKSINAILQREEKEAVHPATSAIFRNIGTVGSVIINAFGLPASQALGMKQHSGPNDLEAKFITAIGIRIANLLLAKGILVQSTVTGELFTEHAAEGKGSDPFATHSYYKLAVLKDKDGNDIKDKDGNNVFPAATLEIINAMGGTQNVLDNLFSVESELLEFSFERIEDKQQNIEKQGSPNLASETRQAQNNIPSYVQPEMWQLYNLLWQTEEGKKRLLEIAGSVHVKDANGVPIVHAADAPGILANNKAIKKDVNFFMDSITDMVANQELGIKQPIFTEQQTLITQRMSEVGIGGLRNKLIRNSLYREEWSSEIDISDDRAMLEFHLRVGEALGYKPSAEMSVVKSEDISAAVSALVRMIQNPKMETMPEADQEAILAAVLAGKEDTHSMAGLIALAQLEIAEIAGESTFKSQMMSEVDGGNNGAMLAYLGLGAATGADLKDAIDSLYFTLIKGGFFKEGDKDTRADIWKASLGNLDLYQQTASDIGVEVASFIQDGIYNDRHTRQLLDAIDTVNEQNKVTKFGAASIINAIYYFTGALIEADGITVSTKGRGIVKVPILALIFGSTVNTGVTNMSNELIKSIYKSIAKASNIEDVGLQNLARKSIIANLNILLSNGALGTYNFDTGNMDSINAPQLSSKMTIEELMGYIDESVGVFTPNQIKAIQLAFKNTLGKAVKAVMNRNFAAYLQQRRSFNLTAGLTHGVYAAAYEALYAQTLQEQMAVYDEDNSKGVMHIDGVPSHALSKQDIRDIEQQLKDMNIRAVVHTPMSKMDAAAGVENAIDSGQFLGKEEMKLSSEIKSSVRSKNKVLPPSVQWMNDREEITDEETGKKTKVRTGKVIGVAGQTAESAASYGVYSKTATNVISGSGEKVFKEDPGVGALPRLIHSMEAAIMAIALIAMNKFGGFNLNDAMGGGTKYMKQMSYELNKATWTVMRDFSPSTELYTSLIEILKGYIKLTRDNKVPNSVKEALKANLVIELNKMASKYEGDDKPIYSDGMIRELILDAKAMSYQADSVRFGAMAIMTSLDQYSLPGSPGGEYLVTDQDKVEVLALQSKLVENISDEVELLIKQVEFSLYKKENITPDVKVSPYGNLGTPTTASDPKLLTLFKDLIAAGKAINASNILKPLYLIVEDQPPSRYRDFQLELLRALQTSVSKDTKIQFVDSTTKLPTKGNIHKNARGWYDIENNTIYVLSDEFIDSGLTTELLTHEIAHSVLAGIVDMALQPNNNLSTDVKALVQELVTLHDLANKYAKENNLTKTHKEALSSIHEFLAYGLTNEAFQRDVLSKITLESKTKSNVLITGMVNFINTITAILFRKSLKTVEEKSINGMTLLISNVAGLLASISTNKPTQADTKTNLTPGIGTAPVLRGLPNPADDGITHVNLFSRGKTEIGRWMSNWARDPIDIPIDGKFASIEGYWFWLGTKNEALRTMVGAEAKKFGESLPRTIKIEEAEFQAKIAAAIKIKAAAYPDRIIELRKENLPLAHYYVFADGKPKDAGYAWITKIWSDIIWDGEVKSEAPRTTAEVATTVFPTVLTPIGIEQISGVYVNEKAITHAEQLELFAYLKPFLETQAAKTNKGPNAPWMIGLGLRWDYVKNNPNLNRAEIDSIVSQAGYGYFNKSVTGQPLGNITPRMIELFGKATGIDISGYDSAIINVYDETSFISEHQDVDESKEAAKYPVVVLNIGGEGNIHFGNEVVDLPAGSSYVFGFEGKNRDARHKTIAGIINGSLPQLKVDTKVGGVKIFAAGKYRISITLRRAEKLTVGMPTQPPLIQKSKAPPTTVSNALRVERPTRITRADVQANRDTLYVFGDNDMRSGMGGQAAAMRGEPNSVGVRTKARPERGANAYWSDANYAENVKKIDEDFARIEAHQGTIVIPAAGLGTGLSELGTRAPRTLAYIESKIAALSQKSEAPRATPKGVQLISGVSSVSNKKEGTTVDKIKVALKEWGLPTDAVTVVQAWADLPQKIQDRVEKITGIKFSIADIAKLRDDKISLKEFANTFAARIKQKDVDLIDARRIGMEVNTDILRNTANWVAQPTGKTLGYKQYLVMNDGTTYDPDSVDHALEASDITRAIYAAEKNGTLPDLLDNEATDISEKRRVAMRSLSNYLTSNQIDYSVAERAMILVAAGKWTLRADKVTGKTHLVELTKSNRHEVGVIGGADAAAISAELRAGKPLKQAMLDGLTKAVEKKKKAALDKGRDGWVKFAQADSQEAAVELSDAVAGTVWCTANEGTARSQRAGGDFWVFFKDGAPEIAVRTANGNLGEVRGATPSQQLSVWHEAEVDKLFKEEKSISGIQEWTGYAQDKADIKIARDTGVISPRLLIEMVSFADQDFVDRYNKNNPISQTKLPLLVKGFYYDSSTFMRKMHGYGENDNKYPQAIYDMLDKIVKDTDIINIIKAAKIIPTGVYTSMKELDIIDGSMATHAGNLTFEHWHFYDINLPMLKTAESVISQYASGRFTANNLTTIGWLDIRKATANLPELTSVTYSLNARSEFNAPKLAIVGKNVEILSAVVSLPSLHTIVGELEISTMPGVYLGTKGTLSAPKLTNVGSIILDEATLLTASSITHINGTLTITGNTITNFTSLTAIGRHLVVSRYGDTRLPKLLTIGGRVDVSDKTILNTPELVSINESVSVSNKAVFNAAKLKAVSRDIFVFTSAVFNAPLLVRTKANTGLHELDMDGIPFSKESGAVQGFVVDDTHAYMIADNIPVGNERAVFMHEVGAHIGLDDKTTIAVANKIKLWKDAIPDSVEAKVYAAAMARMKAANETSDLELVAYMVEEATKAGITPQGITAKTNAKTGSVQWVINWLAKYYEQALARVLDVKVTNITAVDLMNLVYGSVNRAPINDVITQRTDNRVNFSIAGNTTTPVTLAMTAQQAEIDAVSAYSTQDIYAAVASPNDTTMSPEFDTKLKGLLNNIVFKLHGAFGAYKESMRKNEAATPLDVWLKALVTNQPPFSSKILASGFTGNAQQDFVMEQIEATVRAALEDRLVHTKDQYRALEELYTEVEAMLKPADFLGAAFGTNTIAEATAMRDFVFAVEDKNYLARFAALGLAHEGFNKLLQVATATSSSKKVKAKSFVERLQNIFESILEFFQRKITHTYDGQQADSKLVTLIEQLVDIEAKRRHGEKLKLAGNRSLVEPVNDAVAKALEKVAAFGVDLLNKPIIKDSPVKTVQAIGALLRTVAGGRVDFFFQAMSDYRDKQWKGQLGVLGGLLNNIKGPLEKFNFLLLASKLLERMRMKTISDQAKFALESFIDNGRGMTKDDKAALTSVFLRTGAHNLIGHMTLAEIENLLNDPVALAAEIVKQESKLNVLGRYKHDFITDANGLGVFLATGATKIAILKKNAHQMVYFGAARGKLTEANAKQAVETLTILTTLYALSHNSERDLELAHKIMKAENARGELVGNGVSFILDVRKKLEKDSLEQLFNGNPAQMQHGFTPEIYNPHTALVTANEVDGKELLNQSYIQGDKLPADPSDPNREVKHIYTQKFGGLQPWLTGVMGFGSLKAKGSAIHSGFATTFNASTNAAVLTAKIKSIAKDKHLDPKRDLKLEKGNYMSPVYNEHGDIVNWRYEALNHTKDKLLQRNNNFATLIGTLAGTIQGKQSTITQNKVAVQVMYDQHKEEYLIKGESYVAIGPKALTAEHRDMWEMLPEQTKQDVREIWGVDGMMVRSDSVDLLFGYRKLTAATMFKDVMKERAARKLENIERVKQGKEELPTGIFSLKDTHIVKLLVVGVVETLLSMKARATGKSQQDADDYAKRAAHIISKSENIWQAFVTEAKDIIVVKTGMTLLGNVISNFTMLAAQGLSIPEMVKYTLIAFKGATRHKADTTELELLQTQLAIGQTKGKDAEIKRRIEILKIAIENNPVTALIEAGLMPTIVEDVAIDDNIYSYQNQLADTLEPITNRLNPTVLKAVRAAYITHDTKLYKGLAHLTQMSDFVARFALYQHQTTRKKNPISHSDAVLRASESFVNYDIPLHRGLQYSDDMGFTMFTKYFLYIQKALFRVAKENPARVMSLVLLSGFLSPGLFVFDSSLLAKFGNDPFRSGAFAWFGALDEGMVMKGVLSPF